MAERADEPVVVPRARGSRALAVLAALLAVALACAGTAWWREHGQARDRERVALAHRLALHAAELRGDDPAKARDLGLAAVGLHADDRTRAGLTDTLLLGRREDLWLRDFGGARHAELSGDGRVGLVAGDGKAEVWRLGSGRAVVLDGPEGAMAALALSHDGRTALTAVDDGATTVWDLTDPAHPARRATLRGVAGKGSLDDVQAVAVSRDGRVAAVADFAGNLLVWDLTVRDHPVRRSVTAVHDSRTEDLDLSGDGRTAVTTSEDGPVTIWNLADPAHPVKAAELTPAIYTGTAAALSGDGRVLVVARRDPGADWRSQAEVWTLGDPARPALTAVIGMPPADMLDVALTPDGGTALLAGSNGNGSLWDLSVPSRPVRLAGLRGYPSEVSGVALSDGARSALLAAPESTTFSLWDLHDLRQVATGPERDLCDHGSQTLSRTDWDRYTDGADPSDYGGSAGGGDVSLCSLR
ncbi:WD40 repeat domain-containing protein [Nonomuraea sp. NPDC049637]|uniref:WD40 repeat domain-containing protein n=1 Tax=Nonomuraea sp. NPDC049637 TaxID=3154356 RepID=UPI003429E8B0